MEPRLIDAHCHLDLMAYPNTVADEIAGSTHATSRQQKSVPAATQTLSRALASIPGGSSTAAAVPPKSICFAKLRPKSTTSARWGSTFPRVLPEASRFKYRHLTGSAMHSCSALLLGARYQFTPFVRQVPYWTSSNRMDYSSQTPTPPLSSSTGLAVPRMNSSARVMRAVIFPSTNACSHLSEDANTYDRFRSTACCLKPTPQPKQIRKPQRDSSPTHSRELTKSSPNLKPAMRGASSRSF